MAWSSLAGRMISLSRSGHETESTDSWRYRMALAIPSWWIVSRTTTTIPPAMGLSTTLPEGALCLTRRFGDRLISNSEYIEGSLRFWQVAWRKVSMLVKNRHKKTTRRWFHDTTYCFDYSVLSHGTRSGTWTHTARTPRDFKSCVLSLFINHIRLNFAIN